MTEQRSYGGKQFFQKPTDEIIGQCVIANERLLQASFAKWRENYSFFNQTYAIWQTKDGRTLNRPYYYTPKSKAIVLQPLKTQFNYEPKFHREPVGDNEHSEEYADHTETWLQNMAYQLGLSSYSSPYKALIMSLFVCGKAVPEGLRWKAPVDVEEPEQEEDEDDDQFEARYAAWEYQQSNHFPFQAEVIDPSKFLANPFEKNPLECVIRKQLTGHEIEALVLRKQGLKKAYPTSSVLQKMEVDSYQAGENDRYTRFTIEEYFNRGWHAMRLQGGKFLFVERNTMGYVPFKQYYTGNGLLSPDTELADPVDLSVSVYDGNKDAIRAWDQQASTRHNMVIRKGWASRVFKAVGANETEMAGQIERGETVYGLDPDEVGTIAYPEVTRDMFEEQTAMQNGLIENTYPPNLLGQHQPGVNTATESLVLSQAVSRIFDQEAIAEADLATWHGETALQQVDYYGGEVKARGLGLEPKHIQRNYTVRAEFPNVDPTVKLQERAQDKIDLELGAIDMEEYQRRGGIENPTKMRKGRLKDLVRNDPSVVQAMAALVAQELGLPYQPPPLAAPGANGAQPVAPAGGQQ